MRSEANALASRNMVSMARGDLPLIEDASHFLTGDRLSGAYR